jgi:hypothetical protein
VISGKGQFSCGSLQCSQAAGLESFEVNFVYVEAGERKQALVKLRVRKRGGEGGNYYPSGDCPAACRMPRYLHVIFTAVITNTILSYVTHAPHCKIIYRSRVFLCPLFFAMYPQVCPECSFRMHYRKIRQLQRDLKKRAKLEARAKTILAELDAGKRDKGRGGREEEEEKGGRRSRSRSREREGGRRGRGEREGGRGESPQVQAGPASTSGRRVAEEGGRGRADRERERERGAAAAAAPGGGGPREEAEEAGEEDPPEPTEVRAPDILLFSPFARSYPQYFLSLLNCCRLHVPSPSLAPSSTTKRRRSGGSS